ncbi:hypothetical protein WJ968_32705 [Achromobacter xylosoxidans]
MNQPKRKHLRGAFLLQDWFSGENLSLSNKADDGMALLLVPFGFDLNEFSGGKAILPKDMPLQSEHFHIV